MAESIVPAWPWDAICGCNMTVGYFVGCIDCKPVYVVDVLSDAITCLCVTCTAGP